RRDCGGCLPGCRRRTLFLPRTPDGLSADFGRSFTMSAVRLVRIAIACLGLYASGARLLANEPEREQFELVPLTVVGDRQLTGDGIEPPIDRDWYRVKLGWSNPVTIDSVLAEDPSFSLYRRESGVFAHPTTQGANVRGLGANPAARTLVL